jgi:hypothetical protein
MMKIKTLTIVTLLACANATAAGSALALGGPTASVPSGITLGGIMLANVPISGALDTVSEQEAKLWVLNAGYDQVSGLSREGSDVYRGTALLDGNLYAVAVDAAGNVLGIKQ